MPSRKVWRVPRGPAGPPTWGVLEFNRAVETALRDAFPGEFVPQPCARPSVATAKRARCCANGVCEILAHHVNGRFFDDGLEHFWVNLLDATPDTPTCVVQLCDPGYYLIGDTTCLPVQDPSCQPCSRGLGSRSAPVFLSMFVVSGSWVLPKYS